MTKQINYKQLVILTLVSAIFASIAIGVIAKYYLVENAIEKISKEQSAKMSKFAFELIYSGMEQGMKREDFEKLANKISIIEPEIKIKFYKNEKLSSMFGDSAEEIKVKQNDKLIQSALTGQEIYEKNSAGFRRIYPIVATESCLRCHTNVNAGYVNGVVDITYENSTLKETLATTLTYLVAYFVVFLIALFMGLYLNLDRYFISPLRNLSISIKDIMMSNDLERHVHLGSRIREIIRLEYHLNKLISNINDHAKMQEHILSTDRLTGLPNRLKLKEDIAKYRQPLAIIFNIDSFKEVNDLYGVRVGDHVLMEFAKTIQTAFNGNETLYRFAGDEYCVLMEMHGVDDFDIEGYTHSIINLVKKSIFIYNDYEITVDLTAGAALGSDSILEYADIALKNAKKRKKDFVIYTENLQVKKQYEYNIQWTKVLKSAIESNRIRAFYQPIVNNVTGQVEKYETLVRLISEEDNRIISPGAFLEVAKKTKIYPQLTKIVIRNAFRAFAFTNYQFSVNISVEDVLNEDVRDLIFEELASFSKPRNVIFEITEGEGIEMSEEIDQFLSKVRSYGAQIAIDDFGTGYSNFAYILDLSVDIIKIDGSLIRIIDKDRNSELIVKTIVSFCKEMNIKTVAEFVHCEEIYKKVVELGIDYSQGYYFSEPLEHV